MAGSAILDPDVLVDSLVTDVIDGLREDLHPQFGVRAYRVFTVRRTFAGQIVGEGSFTDVETELRPQPRIRRWDGFELDLQRCGVDELGEIMLTEVSLTCTHDDLTGGTIADNEEFLIKVTEAHGQGSPDRYFVHTRPPFIDREKDMGWVLWLRSVDA